MAKSPKVETTTQAISTTPALSNGYVLTTGTTAKEARRNSAADQSRIQQLHDLACELGATCDETEPDADDLGADNPNANGVPIGSADVSRSIDLKTISLTQQCSAVQAALDKERRTWPGYPYLDDANSPWPWVEQVYDDFVIVRIGQTFYQADYTMSATGATLQPRAEWEQVEIDWVPVDGNDAEDAADTEDDMKKIRLQQLTAPQDDRSSIKSLGAGRLGNYIVLWGDENKKDLTDEFFNQETEELDAIFKSLGKLPALYQHAGDPEAKTTVIGEVDVMRSDDIGLWIETQLNLANQYAVAVQRLAQHNALGASSGTLPAARKVAPNGHIKRWPIVECSFTPTPAEARMRSEWPVAELKAIYLEAGLAYPEDHEPTGDAKSRADEVLVEMERLRLLELESLVA